MASTARELNAPPFLHAGPGAKPMVVHVLAALALLAALYSLLYDPFYMLRWGACVLAGLVLEAVYAYLATGRIAFRTGASALTAALLVMSVPTTVPPLPLLYALVVAIVLVRIPSTGSGISLNPMLTGRLFLMLAYGEKIVGWTRHGVDPDAVTTATPLELFHSEEALVSVKALLAGRIGGDWEGLYELVPGSPGEMFGFVILLLGVVLYVRGVISWRTGTAFVAAFLAASAVLRQPLLFSLFSGAVLFSAVFIATDPRSTPVSKGGQLAAGCIAGIVNACVRRFTYYSEGIVFSFLLVNLLSPGLDRAAFALRSRLLTRRMNAARKHTRDAT